MPKDRQYRSLPRHSHRCFYKTCRKQKHLHTQPSFQDLDQRVCPICLEPPHNAVLFFCESIDKGCRPFLCNSSYRHSNCLDQYLKSCGCPRTSHSPSHVLVDRSVFLDFMRVPSRSSSSHVDGDSLNLGSNHPLTSHRSGPHVPARSVRVSNDRGIFRNASRIDRDGRQSSWLRILTQEFAGSSVQSGIQNLQCPLCRGNVMGWGVMDVARKYFDERIRVCSRESCTFVGTYRQLRDHARSKHPSARPCQADPVRQREWQQMEQQRNHEDVLSSINAEMPGAMIFGDYLIEDDDFFDDDEFEGDSMSDEDMPGEERVNTQGNWWHQSFIDESVISRGYSSMHSGSRPLGDHQNHNIGIARTSSQSDRQLLDVNLVVNQEHNTDSERRQQSVDYHHGLSHEEADTSDSDDGSNSAPQSLGMN